MNDATRRIMAEVKEFVKLNKSPNAFFVAAPLDSDLFEWHFTVRGPPDTPFADGLYHGRILLPPEYPLKAPEIVLLTANGRFELNVPICLSVTSHHQETWQPSWGIRTILTALVGFMPSPAEGLGALDFPDNERRRLAARSHAFVCPRCGARPVEQLARKTGGQRLGSGPTKPRDTPASSVAHAMARAETANNSAATTMNDAETAAVVTTASTSGREEYRENAAETVSVRRTVRPAASEAQERGLLYAAYAIVVLIFAILGRRLL